MDFLAEIVVPDVAVDERLLRDVLPGLSMVEDIRSNFSMRPIKVDGALPLTAGADIGL